MFTLHNFRTGKDDPIDPNGPTPDLRDYMPQVKVLLDAYDNLIKDGATPDRAYDQVFMRFVGKLRGKA